MTEVFVADVRPLADEFVYNRLLLKVPSDRKEKLARCRKKEDRIRGLGAGLLLEYGLNGRGYGLVSADTGVRLAEPACGKNGKPYLKNCDGIYFNLSHSGNYAAAAFSEKEVGIDIEQICAAKPGLAERFFMAEEAAYLSGLEAGEKQRVFTEMWTRKESFIKAVGEGMSLPLDSFSVLEDLLVLGTNWYFATFRKPEGMYLSVCGQEESKPVFREVDLTKVFDGGTGNIYNRYL